MGDQNPLGGRGDADGVRVSGSSGQGLGECERRGRGRRGPAGRLSRHNVVGEYVRRRCMSVPAELGGVSILWWYCCLTCTCVIWVPAESTNGYPWLSKISHILSNNGPPTTQRMESRKKTFWWHGTTHRGIIQIRNGSMSVSLSTTDARAAGRCTKLRYPPAS